MSSRFAVLGSGSAGNSALIDAGGFRVLLDCGLSARQISHRLSGFGLRWNDIRAVVLTHTHTDHWNDSACKALAAHGVSLYCHRHHLHELRFCESFAKLQEADLVHHYVAGESLSLAQHLRILPQEISHDAEPTFAFRCEGIGGMFGSDWSIGYAADLGTWDNAVVDFFVDSDILAIEFNHDEHLQRTSGRSRDLISRVLGPRGHLSNRQGATLVAAILDRSSKPPHSLVALHRSQQCNSPELVMSAVAKVIGQQPIAIHLAEQSLPTDPIELTPSAGGKAPMRRRPRRPIAAAGLFDSSH